MASSPTAQRTDFSVDILGRYMCNGLDEAMRSADRNARRPDGSPQSDARPFNAIIIGGGSFGGILAQHLMYADRTNSYRILVLEAGRHSLPEHFQNLPLNGQPGAEIWGLPWRTNVPGGFPGLAYTVGGRSLFFGGWSPRLLPAEMPAARWPAAVVTDLNQTYFASAARQIGTDASNDFMFGALHTALRDLLAAGIAGNNVRHAIPLAQLPLHLSGAGPNPPDALKLEAPLAVQGRPPRPGFFPMNKFSAAPLIMEAARVAQARSGGDDMKKRLMVVPDVHVTRLVTAQRNGVTVVTEVLLMQTENGVLVEKSVPVPEDGVVVIALGTIESTRLALISFPNLPNTGLIGRNLMAHLRSNLTIRIPRAALPAGLPAALESSALFVKGRFQHAPGDVGHFHLQITASGLDRPNPDSEAELFKKIPEVELLDALRQTNDDNVVITIRGIGETTPRNDGSRVTLSGDLDFGVPAAFVELALTNRDQDLWRAMDEAADDVAMVFANGQPYEVFDPPQGAPRQIFIVQPDAAASTVLPFDRRRDGMGSTHHEAGPLWMGTDPNDSVTNADARFHHVGNAYVAGPALLPTVGSPNPMLTGTALAQRLGDHLRRPMPQPDPGFALLFDGASPASWRMSTIKNQPGRDYPGRFHVVDGGLESAPGTDLGLFYTRVPFDDYILRLEWLTWRDDDNSGVFLRFPDPGPRTDYDNTAFVAVDFGYEVQIDALARGSPPPGQNVDSRFRRTGAIYNVPGQNLDDAVVAAGAGQWNLFEIRVSGNQFTVFLNGQQRTRFVNNDPNRGQAQAANRFIGLQTHTGHVLFRRIQIRQHP